MVVASFLFNLFGIALSIIVGCANADTPFYSNYQPQWGFNHLKVYNQGWDVQLLLDLSSGVGFKSKSSFCYGSFRMRMKISDKPSGGVISSFYLTGPPVNRQGDRDEFDFEFVGTGNVASLQTNVFASDTGHREEKHRLWFDPSADFHNYEIIWNPNQVLFNVDWRTIRVFKKSQGVHFTLRPMHAAASLWNASTGGFLNWAGPIDWSKAPFLAYYHGFDIVNAQKSTHICRPSLLDGTMEEWELSPTQQKEYEDTREKSLPWTYCSDKSTRHPECAN